MIKIFLPALTVLALITSAHAQSPGPGWFPTGEWQCGPVRIIASVDGFGAVNFQINGAWFDNNYTLRRGQLYYNGMPCAVLGHPLAFTTPRKATANDPSTSAQDEDK